MNIKWSVKIFIGIFLVVVFCKPVKAQERTSKSMGSDGSMSYLEIPDSDEFNLFKFIGNFFVPRVAKDTWKLKRFIRDDRFDRLRQRLGEANTVNIIFAKAMQITRNDISEALFIATIATMEHKSVGVKLPLVHAAIFFPLTTESDSLFRLRVRRLPAYIYVDSPPNAFGDKDKLQHFFGSAFLSYTFHSRALSEFAGDFVEWGEERFIVAGVSDPRDERADHQGQDFGAALIQNSSIKPSEFLQIQIAQTTASIAW